MWKSCRLLVLLCAVLCACMSASTAAAKDWAEVGRYTHSYWNAEEVGVDAMYIATIDMGSIECHSDARYTYYSVDGLRRTVDENAGIYGEADLYAYRFRHDKKTGEWRCLQYYVPAFDRTYDKDTDFEPFGALLEAGDITADGGVFLTAPDRTLGYIARHVRGGGFGGVIRQEQLRQGEAAYVLRAVLARHKGEKITSLDEGKITRDGGYPIF